MALWQSSLERALQCWISGLVSLQMESVSLAKCSRYPSADDTQMLVVSKYPSIANYSRYPSTCEVPAETFQLFNRVCNGGPWCLRIFLFIASNRPSPLLLWFVSEYIVLTAEVWCIKNSLNEAFPMRLHSLRLWTFRVVLPDCALRIGPSDLDLSKLSSRIAPCRLATTKSQRNQNVICFEITF